MASQTTPGSTHQLYLADTRTERIRPLTAGVVDESSPDVSPDGSTIVFTSGQPDFDIVEIPLDGRPLRELLATTLDEHSAAWVSGENRFVYMTDRNGHTQIRVRSKDTDWDRPVVSQSDFPDDPTRIIRSPVASPDGRLIAYDRQPEYGQPAIWLSPITGGTPTRLIATTGAQYAPDWSPDGKWLSFLWADDGVFRLVKARVGSSKSPQILVDGHLVSSLVPSWSPTGEWILYFSNIDDEFGLKLIAADGGSSRFLADIGIPVGWVWSRDGKSIFAIKINPGTPQLLSIDIETGIVSTIRDFAADTNFNVPFSPGMRFTLAPDGKSFSTTIIRSEMDLWLLEGFDVRRSWRDWLR